MDRDPRRENYNQLNDEKFADTTRIHETARISHTHTCFRARTYAHGEPKPEIPGC